MTAYESRAHKEAETLPADNLIEGETKSFGIRVLTDLGLASEPGPFIP